MKKFIILLILALISNDLLDSDTFIFKQFQKFIKKYHKNYASLNEFLIRFEVFKTNVISTFKENKSHKTGITQFSDLTKEEFTKIYLNFNYGTLSMANIDPYIIQSINAAPDYWDWRENGCVSPVFNQGNCAANWAFSTVDILECLYFKNKGISNSFSEQQLIDCDTLDNGCNGGSMINALAWLKENGIMSDSDYPYTGYKSTCKNDPSKYIDMKVTGYIKLGSSSSTFSPVDEDEMKEFLYENGLLSVGLNANPLQTYTEGIIDVPSSECPANGINHLAILVGYGHDEASDKDYWIVKNSWGTVWGEKGYFRIRRGNGTCGINCYVITATVSF